MFDDIRLHQGSHSHGKAWKSMEKNLVMENGQKNKAMEILKNSWNFFTADHESCKRSSDNSISTGVLQWFGYGRLSVYVLDSQFLMLGGRQTIFLTPYFQFEKRFDFLFVYVMNTCVYFLCLPSWHHGKRRKLSWKSHGILLSDFCGNPAPCSTVVHFISPFSFISSFTLSNHLLLDLPLFLLPCTSISKL